MWGIRFFQRSIIASIRVDSIVQTYPSHTPRTTEGAMVILATHPGARIVGIVRPRRVKSTRCDATRRALRRATDGAARTETGGFVYIV